MKLKINQNNSDSFLKAKKLLKKGYSKAYVKLKFKLTDQQVYKLEKTSFFENENINL